MPLLAGDIGGTKTLLGWQESTGSPLMLREFRNAGVPGLEGLLADFLNGRSGANVDLVLALAGPVDAGRCQLTNLPWCLDAGALQQQFGFRSVQLLNDLVATAWAMPGLAEQGALVPLRGACIDFRQPVAVISVGTGLGEALLWPQGERRWAVLPSEGGHKTVAPFDALSARLLQQHWDTARTPASRENWFSGSGLPHLFQALFPDRPAQDSATITRQAAAAPDSAEARCVALLAQGLLAEAGDLALQYAAWGGVIFAGGAAQHLETFLRHPDALARMSDKAAHQTRLQSIPLALCHDTQAALKGAAAFFYQQQGG